MYVVDVKIEGKTVSLNSERRVIKSKRFPALMISNQSKALN
jgi:hypothetical protein